MCRYSVGLKRTDAFRTVSADRDVEIKHLALDSNVVRKQIIC